MKILFHKLIKLINLNFIYRYIVPNVAIVSYKDLYDRKKSFHINTSYGGNVKLRMSIQKEYYIPRPAIDIFFNCVSNLQLILLKLLRLKKKLKKMKKMKKMYNAQQLIIHVKLTYMKLKIKMKLDLLCVNYA